MRDAGCSEGAEITRTDADSPNAVNSVVIAIARRANYSRAIFYRTNLPNYEDGNQVFIYS